jgi:hypothetical protein
VQDENRKVRKETSAQKFKKSEEIQDTTDKWKKGETDLRKLINISPAILTYQKYVKKRRTPHYWSVQSEGSASPYIADGED